MRDRWRGDWSTDGSGGKSKLPLLPKLLLVPLLCCFRYGMDGPECSDDAVPLSGEALINAAPSDELGVKVNEGGLLMGEGPGCFAPGTGDGGADPAEREPISSPTGEEDMVDSVDCR